MDHEKKQPIWTKTFIGIFLSNFFIFISFYGLITSLPIFVVDELHRSAIDAGLVVTIFLISAIIVRPFSGKLLEDFGKKKMLLISLIFFTLSSFMYLWVDQFALLLALRFFHGIWFSIATTATGAIAADIVPVKRRGEGLGYFMMSTNLAVVFGPFVALTLLQATSSSTLFLVLALFVSIGLLFTLTSKVNAVNASHANETKIKKRLQPSDLFDQKALPVAFVAGLIGFAYSSVLSFLSSYANELKLLEAASFFFIVFAVVMIISRPFTGRLFDSKGPNIVIYPSLVILMIGLFLLSITDSAFMLLLSGALMGLGYGTIVPCFQTLAIQATERHRSGHATATFFTLYDTGIAVGSYFLGIVAAQLGYSLLYFFASVFMIVVIVLYKLMLNRKDITSFKLKETETSL